MNDWKLWPVLSSPVDYAEGAEFTASAAESLRDATTTVLDWAAAAE